MADRTIADRILELAQSETKRWGGTEPSLTHVAFVLANHWQKEFAEAFGSKGREQIEYMLRTKLFRGDEASVRALLATAPDINAAIKAVHDALDLPGATADSAPAVVVAEGGDHEHWLVALIDDRFAKYAASPSSDVLDELYVLIAALKVAGLESAHEAMKQKLVKLRKPKSSDSSDGEEAADTETDGRRPELSERTSRFLWHITPSALSYRAAEATQIASQLLRPQAPIVAIIGDSGVGRTALLGEVAARLAATEHKMPVWRMSPASIIANPSSSLKMALEDTKSPGVIVVDDLDMVADLGTQDPDRGLLEVISDARFHPYARIVLIINQRRLSRVSVLNQALDESIVRVTLGGLPPSAILEIIAREAAEDVAGVNLALSPGVAETAVSPAESTATTVHPGLAIGRIDAAIGRALLEGAKTVTVEHLSAPGGSRSVETETKDLAEVLRARVRGQDDAIDAVAKRLALTRAGLDLRPQRPNGVFLFAGPTGVGKTELAKQVALAEFGSDNALIVLDMSEYASDAFGRSKLIGPGPGYVGSTEPEGWLTTKVIARPKSVVLLDEIEKAHPSIWNLFLQVFDAGRLTDGLGNSADFSETVVIMTSNIGVREASKNAIGFGAVEGQSGERQLAAIRETMAPELINRLDDIILFNPLSMDAIVEIACVELAATKTRLGAAGWQIEYDDSVPTWLAETGYAPAYGARHLIRNIEREFLGLLAKADGRKVHVEVKDNALASTAR